MMDLEELKQKWIKEEKHAFKGWDFSYIEDRWDHEDLPWNYKNIVLKYLKESDELLDMGTGGGEFLLSLNHPYRLTSVTEAYTPNVKLCKEKLSPLGIEVKQIFKDEDIPYKNNKFDIIINRHEAYNAREVSRMIKSGGYFITQQVGGKNNNDLSNKLLADFSPKYPNHNLNNNIKSLKENGFKIILSNEYFPKVKFYDIGALVYFAKIIEWEFSNFSVDRCFDNLYELKKELEQKGYVSGTEHRFLIVAKKL